MTIRIKTIYFIQKYDILIIVRPYIIEQKGAEVVFYGIYFVVSLLLFIWVLMDARARGITPKVAFVHGLLAGLVHVYIIVYILWAVRRKRERPEGGFRAVWSLPVLPLLVFGLFAAGCAIQCVWFYTNLLLPTQADIQRMAESDSSVSLIDISVIQSDQWYNGTDAFLLDLDSAYKTLGMNPPAGAEADCIAFSDADGKAAVLLFEPGDPYTVKNAFTNWSAGRATGERYTPWHFFPDSGWNSFYWNNNIIGTRVDTWFRDGQMFVLLSYTELGNVDQEQKEWTERIRRSLEGS